MCFLNISSMNISHKTKNILQTNILVSSYKDVLPFKYAYYMPFGLPCFFTAYLQHKQSAHLNIHRNPTITHTLCIVYAYLMYLVLTRS